MNNLDNYFNVISSGNKIFHSFLIGNIKYNDIKMDLNNIIYKYFFDNNSCENPDYYILTNENGNISKEDIKKLLNNLSTTSQFNNKKVYVIDECEKLNDSVYNSILKTLEEPKDNIYAILLTSNIDAVKPTIASRCQKIFISSESNFDIIDNDNSQIANNIINIIENDRLKSISKHPEIYSDIEDRNIFNNVLKIIMYKYLDGLNELIYNMDEINNVIVKNNDVDKISKKILIINKFINLLDSYLNKNLCLDRFIIEMSRC